jgi:hypothetical protein
MYEPGSGSHESRWGDYSLEDKEQLLAGIGAVVRSGKMPPARYTPLNEYHTTKWQAAVDAMDSWRNSKSVTVIVFDRRMLRLGDPRIILAEDRGESFVLSTQPIGLLELAQCFPNGFDLFNVDHMS